MVYEGARVSRRKSGGLAGMSSWASVYMGSRATLPPNVLQRYDERGKSMAKADTYSDIDWMQCELIEKIPGKVSGRPIVRGTRIMPDAFVDSYDLGETIDELREGFPSLSVSQIQRLRICPRQTTAASPVKVLLDENLDHALRKLLGQHEVVTVAYMGWTGLKNGELLRTAEDHRVDVLLTGDATLAYEQNLTGRASGNCGAIGYPAAYHQKTSSKDNGRN